MSLVTVSEMVRFALPSGSTVMAGATGLGRPVTWARLLRARPATLGVVESGEVWLLSAGALHQAGDPRAVARLIRDVAGAGVVALVASECLGPESLAEADRVGTPFVLLPAETPLADVEKSIVSLVVDRDRAIGQRVQEIYDRLLATLVEDRGPELLVRTVCEVIGKAVYLLDEHFQATVHAGGDERTAEGLSQLRRRFWEGPAAPVYERLITLGAGGGMEGLAVLVRPLVLRGAIEGYLALVGPRDDFGDFDYQVADRTASVLAIELAKQSAVVEARLRVQGDFLEELLDKQRPDPDQLMSRARALGYDLTRPHLVFVLRPRVAGNSVTPRQHQRFVDVARRRLVLANVATLLRAREDTLQVVAPCPSGVAPDDHKGAVAWVERLRAELESLLATERLPLTAGIGRSANGNVTYHAALKEALQSAEIAATLPGGSATLHFAHLGALRLIFHLAGNPELQAFQRDLLGPLEEYDRVHRTELVRTLDGFFRAGGNHVQAARDLNVHRNTLIYRLERMRDLLGGVDLEDPDSRLSLQLALKIRAAFRPQG